MGEVSPVEKGIYGSCKGSAVYGFAIGYYLPPAIVFPYRIGLSAVGYKAVFPAGVLSAETPDRLRAGSELGFASVLALQSPDGFGFFDLFFSPV